MSRSIAKLRSIPVCGNSLAQDFASIVCWFNRDDKPDWMKLDVSFLETRVRNTSALPDSYG
jgi:hypothetical protein